MIKFPFVNELDLTVKWIISIIILPPSSPHTCLTVNLSISASFSCSAFFFLSIPLDQLLSEKWPSHIPRMIVWWELVNTLRYATRRIIKLPLDQMCAARTILIAHFVLGLFWESSTKQETHLIHGPLFYLGRRFMWKTERLFIQICTLKAQEDFL